MLSFTNFPIATVGWGAMALSHSHSGKMYTYDLPYNVQKELANFLDYNDDWKDLAGRLDYDVLKIDRFRRSNSPTEALLQDLSKRNYRIEELSLVLRAMGHVRALELLESVNEVVSAVNPAFYEKVPLPDRLPGKYPQHLQNNSGHYNNPGSMRMLANVLPRACESRSDAGKFSQQPQQNFDNYNTSGSKRMLSKNVAYERHDEKICRDPEPKHEQNDVSDNTPLAPCNVLHINEAELKLATNNWSTSLVIGKGGFGTVYRGSWKNTDVAIKRLENMAQKGREGAEFIVRKQLTDELGCLNDFRHNNILQLMGYSLNGEFPCIVYPYLPNGSLEDRLLLRNRTPPLDWQQRLKIVLGTARGLQFLHTAREKPKIHGDIKSANILLNSNFEAVIGDFGLAKDGPQAGKTSTRAITLQGTSPYLPFEYIRERRLSIKVDTYSFGMVLYEVCTGLRACEKSRDLREYVSEWQQKNLMDSKAGSLFSHVYAPMMHLGDKCTENKRDKRPEMILVLKELEYLASLQAKPVGNVCGGQISNHRNSLEMNVLSSENAIQVPDLSALLGDDRRLTSQDQERLRGRSSTDASTIQSTRSDRIGLEGSPMIPALSELGGGSVFLNGYNHSTASAMIPALSELGTSSEMLNGSNHPTKSSCPLMSTLIESDSTFSSDLNHSVAIDSLPVSLNGVSTIQSTRSDQIGSEDNLMIPALSELGGGSAFLNGCNHMSTSRSPMMPTFSKLLDVGSMLSSGCNHSVATDSLPVFLDELSLN